MKTKIQSQMTCGTLVASSKKVNNVVVVTFYTKKR
jgi:hypothetical protein